MKFKVILEEEDISFIKDIIYNISNNLVSDYKVKELFKKIPNYIKIKALDLGLDDADVKDLVFDWLKNQYYINKFKTR